MRVLVSIYFCQYSFHNLSMLPICEVNNAIVILIFLIIRDPKYIFIHLEHLYFLFYELFLVLPPFSFFK